MSRILATSALLVMMPGFPAFAAVVSAGNYSAPPGVTVLVPITIAGSETLTGMTLGMKINDGPPEIGGTTLVPVFSGFLPGDVWRDPIWTQFAPDPPYPPKSYIGVSAFEMTTGGGPLVSNGMLVRLLIDTTAANPGVYALRFMRDVTEVDGTGGPLSVDLNDGTLTITPEPATVMLLVPALLLLGRRRGRRVSG